jgi:hypothetical protein
MKKTITISLLIILSFSLAGEIKQINLNGYKAPQHTLYFSKKKKKQLSTGAQVAILLGTVTVIGLGAAAHFGGWFKEIREENKKKYPLSNSIRF